MGMVLFTIFHRSLMVIYYMLLNNDFQRFSFGMTEATLRSLDFFTLLITLFFGGWYGTGLGIHWYRLVYEGPHRAGLFRAVIPHHWRKDHHHQPHARPAAHPSAAPVPAPAAKAPRVVHVQAHAKKMDSINVFEQLQAMRPRVAMPWDIDDIEDTEVERSAAKKPAKRKARATTAKAKPRKTAARKKSTRSKQPAAVTEES